MLHLQQLPGKTLRWLRDLPRWLRNLPHAIKDSGQLPNALSLSRCVLAVVLFILMLVNPGSWLNLALFLGIAATDKLDGYLARHWEQITDLGKILDPLADKLLVIGVVVALCLTDTLASPWGWAFLAINVVREAGVTALRWWRKRGQSGLVIAADKDGKRKMFLQSAGIGLAMMPLTFWWWPIVFWIPLSVSLFFSVRSGIHYVRQK